MCTDGLWWRDVDTVEEEEGETDSHSAHCSQLTCVLSFRSLVLGFYLSSLERITGFTFQSNSASHKRSVPLLWLKSLGPCISKEHLPHLHQRIHISGIAWGCTWKSEREREKETIHCCYPQLNQATTKGLWCPRAIFLISLSLSLCLSLSRVPRCMCIKSIAVAVSISSK